MKQIQLTRGMMALVDDADFERLNQYKWYCHSSGYAARDLWKKGTNTKTAVFMHREILGLVKGDGKIGDHRNLIKTDNQRDNLRACTNAENGLNRGPQSNNKSGFKGVSWSARACKWVAFIKSGRTHKQLCSFESPEAAHRAYCAAATQMHGAFARAS